MTLTKVIKTSEKNSELQTLCLGVSANKYFIVSIEFKSYQTESKKKE